MAGTVNFKKHAEMEDSSGMGPTSLRSGSFPGDADGAGQWTTLGAVSC